MKQHVYIEHDPNKPYGNYAVKVGEPAHTVASANTQAEAVQIAKMFYPNSSPDIERVRYTSQGTPGRWR